jgi:signal transduction histidine kinase/CheY-like chemotaxis protein
LEKGLDFYAPSSRPLIEEAVHRALEFGEPYDLELEIMTAGGKRRTVHAIGKFNREQHKIFGFFQDITDRKLAEEQQLSLERQFHQAQRLESLGLLAGGVAHDFNNILTSVLGFAELVKMRLPAESPAADHLHQIENAARRAADLAGQMLAYSGKGRFVVEALDVNQLIEEMIHILQVSISKKAALSFDYGQHLPAVEADATQIRQIVMNLVINASEAIGDRSGTIDITTGVMECAADYLKGTVLAENLIAGRYVYVEVADTGCGMDAKTLQHLFDPFFSTKFTGRGLGMAAVLGIVRGHRGSIRVESKLGKGTVFRVLLPASSRTRAANIPSKLENPWRGSGKILFVDDEKTVRAVGREMLQELGFEVVLAGDGREALNAFQARHDEFHCILMDLTMPHMDGHAAFHEIRQIAPTIPIIMTSGYTEQNVSEKFPPQSLQGFLQKPFRISALREALRAVVEAPCG